LSYRPSLFVKIPATRAGLPAIAQCLAEGISIKVTLIFSLQRYTEVIDAFIEGVERARAAGHDLTWLASVGLLVSRVDTEIDKQLDTVGSVEAKGMRSTAAITHARLASDLREGLRLPALAAARRGRGSTAALLWASTG
jgi:transaldolase